MTKRIATQKPTTKLATVGVSGELAARAAEAFEVEGTDTNDLLLSFLKLFHGTADEIANLDEPITIQPGQWYDSVSQQAVETENRPVMMVHGRKEYLYWEDNRVVARAMRRGDLDPEIAADAVETWTFAALFEDRDMPYVAAFKKSGIKAAKKMHTTINDRRMAFLNNPEGGYTAPTFVLGFKFADGKDANGNTQTYRRVTATLSPDSPSEDWVQRGLEWGERLKSIEQVVTTNDGETF